MIPAVFLCHRPITQVLLAPPCCPHCPNVFLLHTHECEKCEEEATLLVLVLLPTVVAEKYDVS